MKDVVASGCDAVAARYAASFDAIVGFCVFLSHFPAETTLRLVGEAGFEIVRQAIETQLEGDREVEYV